MTSGTTTSPGRSKDGVPIWDGNAATFTAYEEEVMTWEQGVPYHKRYLCGPRLSAELTGAAKRMLIGKPADWVSFNGGVQLFLQHLRQSLGRLRLPEATDFLNKYFRNGRRKYGESMNDYITRKMETYWRACQALQRVMPKGKQPSVTEASTWGSRRSSWATSYGGDEDDDQDEANDDDQGRDGQGTGTTPSTTTWTSANSWWSWNTWGYGSQWDWNDSWSNRSWTPYSTRPESTMLELLPEFVQAWYLLADAGLTVSERNMIHTAVKGNYTLSRVAHELRTQHGEDGGRTRPPGQAYMGTTVEEDEHEDDEEIQAEELFMAGEDLNEDELSQMQETQRDIESANAVIQDAKRTLRAARERQHQVKMSRKFFRTPSRGANEKPRDDSAMTCLKCGKVGHRARNCPSQEPSKSKSGNQSESAPFVCFARQGSVENEALSASMGPSTQEAITEGYCVVDGGATKTLGSVKALEDLLARNLAKHGHTRLQEIDTQNKPVFGFGNSSEDQCVSTVRLGIRANGLPGEMTIHALETGQGPILLSVEALRKLGAVIDFAEDLVAFRGLDKHKVVPLRRSQTGHQLLDLSDDIFAKAQSTQKPVPSLKEFI